MVDLLFTIFAPFALASFFALIVANAFVREGALRKARAVAGALIVIGIVGLIGTSLPSNGGQRYAPHEVAFDAGFVAVWRGFIPVAVGGLTIILLRGTGAQLATSARLVRVIAALGVALVTGSLVILAFLSMWASSDEQYRRAQWAMQFPAFLFVASFLVVLVAAHRLARHDID